MNYLFTEHTEVSNILNFDASLRKILESRNGDLSKFDSGKFNFIALGDTEPHLNFRIYCIFTVYLN